MIAVEFPISIGLIGAPGSGKTQLAQAFYEISNQYFEDNDSELWIIENAGKTIEQDFDHAMGIFGDYADDLRAYFRRYEAEQMARAKGVSFITLGTAIDHIAHSGINLEAIMTGLQTPDLEAKVSCGRLSMGVLTTMFQQQFRYTFGFYVPHPGASVILPGTPETESEYNQKIDNAIRMIFANFGMRIQILDQPTMEEKAEEMFATVKRIIENGPDKLEPEAEELDPDEFTVEDTDPESSSGDVNLEVDAPLPD